ncbi:hypothetical protein MT068_001409 [Salmonella enterica]|nr:hypothetical protein [Salmonella enterica]
MYKLLVVIWFGSSNRANTSQVIDFDSKIRADEAYDNIKQRNKESRNIVYEVTKLY